MTRSAVMGDALHKYYVQQYRTHNWCFTLRLFGRSFYFQPQLIVIIPTGSLRPRFVAMIKIAPRTSWAKQIYVISGD
jgi:hypothetical protein